MQVPPESQVEGLLTATLTISNIAGNLALGFNFGFGVNTFSTDGAVPGLTLEKGDQSTDKFSMTGKFIFKDAK